MQEEELPADASSLIYLAKADAFAAAFSCVGGLLAPPAVWREAVEAGEHIGAAEVPRIRAAAEQELLRIVELSTDQQELAATIAAQHRLGLGESEVLALGTAIGRAIVDEGRATRAADALAILPVSTLFLPVLGRRSGSVDEGEAVALL